MLPTSTPLVGPSLVRQRECSCRSLFDAQVYCGENALLVVAGWFGPGVRKGGRRLRDALAQNRSTQASEVFVHGGRKPAPPGSGSRAGARHTLSDDLVHRETEPPGPESPDDLIADAWIFQAGLAACSGARHSTSSSRAGRLPRSIALRPRRRQLGCRLRSGCSGAQGRRCA